MMFRSAALLAIGQLLCMAYAEPQKESRMRGAFFGSLVADAISLGSHYEYDAKVIKKAYGGTISRYMAPGEEMGGSTHGVGWGRRNFHPGQGAGDQTDYGEYNVLVLEYLANRKNKKGPIELKDLVPHWRKRLEGKWGAWKCTQTKQTLQQVQQGVDFKNLGGGSNAMAVRHTAAHAVFEGEDEIAQAARDVMFTHKNSEALGGGEFFARVVHRIIHENAKPLDAFEAAAKKLGKWYVDKVKQGVDKFNEATDPSSPLSKEEFVDDLAATSMARLWDVGKSEPIKVGKASPTEGTLPTSVYLILKYENDFDAGVKANAMIGGDSASRAVAVGAVLGAIHGVEAIPENLKNTLNHWKTSAALLDTLPLLSTRSEL
jgi:ADP-ribosylglycohydrolase